MLMRTLAEPNGNGVENGNDTEVVEVNAGSSTGSGDEPPSWAVTPDEGSPST